MGLCKAPQSTQQRLEAMRWYFGKRHCRNIAFADNDDDHGQYFDLNTFGFNYTEKKYVVFLDDGNATAPTIASDVTLITITVTSGDTANDKALALESALQADEVEARTMVMDDSVDIQNWFVGTVTEEVNTNAPDLTFTIDEIGFGGYIGQTGESELTTTTEVVQLVDDAQGTVVQDEIITGYTQEISVPLRELTTERWKTLVGNVTGNNIEIDGKEITGYGTKKLYQSMFNYAGRLIGHPVRLESTNIDEDIVMLQTAPKLESLNFSGASIQEASFLFTSYKSANAPEEINLLARGDHSKY